MQHRSRSVLNRFLMAVAVMTVAACQGPAAGSEDPSESAPREPTADAGRRYSTQAFDPALDVTAAQWLSPAPDEDEPTFLTWLGEGTDVDRAVRFLVPVTLYAPGTTAETVPPDDYLAYLRTQAQHGARLADETTITIDGQVAAILTATTSQALDGSLGCPAAGIPAVDCFGLQPELALRLAVIDTGDTTLLAWARGIEGTENAEEFADFERMLSGLTFR